MAFSHRDRREHRAVQRALVAMVAAVAGLTVLALLAPRDWLGVLALLALGLTGLVAVSWGHSLLGRYSADLRAFGEGSLADGFARVELVRRLALDRPVGHPAGQSPHSRGSRGATRAGDDVESRGNGPDRGFEEP